MSHEKGKELRRHLDEYVGSGGNPADVLELLADSMYETASHLESNWQDRKAASFWRRLSKSVTTLAQKVDREYQNAYGRSR